MGLAPIFIKEIFNIIKNDQMTKNNCVTNETKLLK